MGVVFKQLKDCHAEKGIWLLWCSPCVLNLCVEFIGRQISAQFKEELSYQSDLLEEGVRWLGGSAVVHLQVLKYELGENLQMPDGKSY